MTSRFRHIALFGKHHTSLGGDVLAQSRRVLDDMAHFVARCGAEVVIERGANAATSGASGAAAQPA